jgi:hypothetical protein
LLLSLLSSHLPTLSFGDIGGTDRGSVGHDTFEVDVVAAAMAPRSRPLLAFFAFAAARVVR